MPEETTTTAVVEETTTTEPEPDRKDTDTEKDEPLRPEGEKALGEFKKRARDAEKRAKDLEARIQQFEDKDKSELERATSQRDAAAKERDEAKAQALRLRVAIDKKLPTELVDRLKGSSQEELETDAEALLKLVKPAETTDFDGGARKPAPEQKTPEQAHNDFLGKVLSGEDPT